ncbi:hypothetical protein Csa_021745 [Cucumis sativus]|nr:hypothetical protein Csa_021745 [Cucumis sativus]
MTSTSSCQLDLIRILLGPAHIYGMLYCTIDGSVIYGEITPTFPNAAVQMQCGAETVVTSVKTDATGNFSIFLDAPRLMLLYVLTNCTLVVTTPLVDCNAALPSFGTLVSPLQLIGNTFHGLFNVTNFIPRLPRLVGLPKALEMMLTSKPVKGEEAFSLGLVDAIVPREELISAARKWALDISERRKPWIISLHKTNKLESLADAREIFKFARAQVRKQAPNLKHPLVCIDVVETGVVSGPRAGLQKEIEDFQVLLHADTSKSLIHVFFAQRGTTKVPGVSDLGLTPRRINKVAVIGGGLMGSGIATALILSNYPVILKEVNEKFLEAGLGRVKANLQSRVRKGTMTPEKFERTISLLKGVLDYESFKDVDMVIEAVIENISLKQQIIVSHLAIEFMLLMQSSTQRIKILILEAANLLLSGTTLIFPPFSSITEGQIASAVGFSLLVRALILIIGPSPLGLLLFRAPSATHMSPTLRNRLAFRPRPCLFHLEYLGPPIPCHRMRPFNRTRSDCAIIAGRKFAPGPKVGIDPPVASKPVPPLIFLSHAIPGSSEWAQKFRPLDSTFSIISEMVRASVTPIPVGLKLPETGLLGWIP